MPEAHTNMPGVSSPVRFLSNPTGAGLQATSRKRQATSVKQGSSDKLQAASYSKRGWFESFINFQGASGKRQAPSSKHQAASHELLAL
jgi:hypothetical protein